MNEWVMAALGGLSIGCGAALLLITTGRILGISGICAGLWNFRDPANKWRLTFLLGLMSAAVIWAIAWPERFASSEDTYWVRALISGSMVGFGTRLANGCTSGHGVCGVSRFSKRSITATAVFLGCAILTVMAVRLFGGT